MDNISVIENNITFKDIEEKIYKTVCDVACEIMKETLEEIDRRLMVERNTKELRNKGFKHTCIKTIMGNVEFDRRIYKFITEDGKVAYKYLLDEYLQMNCIGHVSLNLVDRIVENIVNLSFRKTSRNIEKLSNQNISHTAIWNITQKLGSIIDEIDKNKIKKNKQGILNGEKECNVLFQEMDGLWINMQGKDRPKSGKSRKKEIKLGAIYEGWRERRDNRKEDEVVGKTVYSSFESSKKFKELGEATIAEIYNVDKIETRIVNGDGANWIKKIVAEDEGIHYQLDPFHRSQSIVRYVSDNQERKKLISIFNKGKVEEGLEKIKELLIKNNENEKEFEKLSKLYNYLVANKEGLVPYQLRPELSKIKSPKDLKYKGMGTMEGNILNVLGGRLKGGKRSWSKRGSHNIAKILTESANGRISSIIDDVYSNVITTELMREFEDIVVLSASDVTKGLKKVSNHVVKKCSLPYEGYAITEGRKAIRNLVKYMTWNNLVL